MKKVSQSSQFQSALTLLGAYKNKSSDVLAGRHNNIGYDAIDILISFMLKIYF